MGGAVSGGVAPAGEFPVVLNVYDLTPMNNYVHWCGLGIFHSAVEVHGSEYSFGAHDYPTSGVFEVEPKNCPGFLYRSSIFIGRTSLQPLQFRDFIQRMASEYHGDTYHLISKNCNHFTDDLSTRLTGKPIPGWVNRLAKLGAFCNCLLPESMRLESTETKNLTDYDFSDFCQHGMHDTSYDTLTMTSLNYAQGDGSNSNATIKDPFEDDDVEDKHLLSQSSSFVENAIVQEVHR